MVEIMWSEIIKTKWNNFVVREKSQKNLFNDLSGDETRIHRKNTELNDNIKNYRKSKKENIETQRPELRIWKKKLQFDKTEPDKITIFDDDKNTFQIKIWEWDILQVNNKEIFDDTEKAWIIDSLKLEDSASERSEVQDKEKFDLNKTYKFTFDFYIPNDFPIIDNRLVIWQRKQVAKDWVNQNPLIAQRFRNWKYSISLNNNWDPKWKVGNKTIYELDAEDILWKRISAEYQIKFSENEDWFIKIKHNWKTILEHHWKVSSSSQTYAIWEYYEDKFYFKFWLYRDNYKKRLLEINNEEQTDENKIKAIKQAINEEGNWKLMTILFRNYNTEKIE
jgi:hypothetical protein